MTPFEDVIDAFAVYRSTKLVVNDTIFDAPRQAVLDHLDASDSPIARKAAEGIECPWCVSVWLAGGAFLARRYWPRAWRAYAWIMAAAAVAGLLSGHEYEPDEMTVDLHEKD